MKMLGLWDNTLKICATGALIAIPTLSHSGGYGNAGVADDKVGRYAAQAGIWCPALEATIPQNLYAEMDCGEQNVARSAVAGERVTNRSGGLFGLLGPHEPQGRQEPQSDSDASQISAADPSNPVSNRDSVPGPNDGPDTGSDPDKGPNDGPDPDDGPNAGPDKDKKDKKKKNKKDKKKKNKHKKGDRDKGSKKSKDKSKGNDSKSKSTEEPKGTESKEK